MQIENGLITEKSKEDIAKDLKINIEILQGCLKQAKDLSFIAVVDVLFNNGLVYLRLDVKSEAQLETIYENLLGRKNAFSEWLSNYFMDKSMEFIAGLSLNTKINCHIWIPKNIYLKCKLELCEQEECDRNENNDEQSKPVKNNISSVSQMVAQIESSNSMSKSKITPTDTTSIDSKVQKPPGGYPYESREQQLPSSTKGEFVMKTFLLYYPYTKGWTVKRIQIESDSKYLKAIMKRHGPEMYEYSVNIPKEEVNFSYHYICHLKSESLFNVKGNLMGTPPVRSRNYHVDEKTLQRDSWMRQGQKIQDPFKYDEECLAAHLTDILFHCESNISINDACNQIEKLCERSLPKMNALRLLKEFEQFLPSGSNKTKLLFVVAIGNVLKNPQQLEQGETLTRLTIKSLLDNLRYFRLGDFHASCRVYVKNVCFALCWTLYGEQMCVVEYLNTCCPFYDDTFILDRLQYYVKTRTIIARDKESIFDHALQFCYKLYNSSRQESSNQARDALDILLRHFSFNMTLFVVSKMLSNISGMSADETDLQNVLSIAFQVRIDTELRAIKKDKNIPNLYDLWKKITSSVKAYKQLQTKFEETLLIILEALPSSIECSTDIVAMFVIDFGFFRNEIDKRKFLHIIMVSHNQNIHELFFTILQNEEFANVFDFIEIDAFQRFSFNYLTGNTHYKMERGQEFQGFFTRFCRLWNLKNLPQSGKQIEVLKNILLQELDKYRLNELLKHTKAIDIISDENKDIGTIFECYISHTLKERNERPEDVLKNLSDQSGKPILETNLAAKLVCMLLDMNEIKSGESSDFDNFLHLVAKYQFWIPVFQCTGQHIDIVHMNSNYIAARVCISRMGNYFKTHEVNFEFVQKLEKSQESRDSAKRLLELEFYTTEIDQYWSEALNRFKEVKDKLRKTHEVLAHVKQNSPNLPVGFENVLTKICENEKRFVTGIIKANECRNNTHMWQDIEQLPDICEYLYKVISS
ncbi:uncharacterized protein LOC132759840 [Ruditapes philippinarum]|uniref:uncharacterized protein LOC132759840 n=1 Tax=Ruditapes philippinarum TaxID=129788 RepID=UPI00295C14C3|nr:uncharacterized protein LOC132759840 [Ruditapes philippinarum]